MGNTCPKHASQESVRSGADGDVEMREKRVDKSQNERAESRRWLGRLSAWCCGGKTDDAVEIGTPVDYLVENGKATDANETDDAISHAEGIVSVDNTSKVKPKVFMGRKALSGFIDFQKYLIDPSHRRIMVGDRSNAAKQELNVDSCVVRLNDLKDTPGEFNEVCDFSKSAINFKNYIIDTSNAARPTLISESKKCPFVNTVGGVIEAHIDVKDNQAVDKKQYRVRTFIITNGSYSNIDIASRLNQDNESAVKNTRKRKFTETKCRHKSLNIMHENQRKRKHQDKSSTNQRTVISVKSTHTLHSRDNTARQKCDSQEANGYAKKSVALWDAIKSTNEAKELSTGDNKFNKATKRENIREVKKMANFAISQAVMKMDNHKKKSDCPIEVYVRSPSKVEILRKVPVRVGMKEIKNGRAKAHLSYLEGNARRQGTKRVYKDHWAKREIIRHPVSRLAHDERTVHRWIQTHGPRTPSTFFPPPVYECPRRTYHNARQKMGLDNLRNCGIIIQCAEIERVKILSNEFPGVLPLEYKKTWRKEFRRYTKTPDVTDND